MPLVWIPETAGILGSALLLAALAVLLACFDDKAVFDWKGVTLNAVVSLISTASKASLLFAVSELISQWKWILFTRTSRPLIDFERVDAASRGPMGSLRLLWKARSIGYLQLGSLVVVLSIAADPLTQQLIQYKERVVYAQSANTTVSRAGRFSKGSEVFQAEVKLSPSYFNQTTITADADFSIQSAILYGLEQPIHSVMQQVNFKCPTGNCTWPSFESLAVCNRCTNLEGNLQPISTHGSQASFLDKDSTNYTRSVLSFLNGTAFRLPNGLYLDNANELEYGGHSWAGSVWMTMLGTANASETIKAQEIDTLIWSMSMIRARPDPTNTSAAWPSLPLSAMECTLFYCVKEYETTVTDGSLREISKHVMDATRVKTSWRPEATYATNLMNELQINSIAFHKYFSAFSRTDLVLSSPGTGSRFNISKVAVDSISSYFQSNFASKLYTLNITDPPSATGKLNGYYVNATQTQYKPGVMQALLSSRDLNATFTALAASMSNAIRTGADESSDSVPDIVTGLKGDVKTFYKIVWPWIILHCIIVSVGVAFLFVTIRENQRHGQVAPLWRSSSLAIASRGEAVTDVVSGMQTLEEMWKKARVSQVTLFGKNETASSSLEHPDSDPLVATS